MTKGRDRRHKVIVVHSVKTMTNLGQVVRGL